MKLNSNPPWLSKKLISTGRAIRVKEILSELGVRTVCESGACPNLNECYSKGRATFLILGNTCTRNCAFCLVNKGYPEKPEQDEPYRTAETVRRLGLEYVIITSVTRDDLNDGGAGQYIKTIESIRALSENVRIEILVPDFCGMEASIGRVLKACPDVFSHNVETAEWLYPKIRSGADYRLSLSILKNAKRLFPSQITKSGIMAGLGETDADIYKTIEDIRETGCDILTIGQYLRPSEGNLPVNRYVDEDTFRRYREFGEKIGFRHVASGSFVRSSYFAEDNYNQMKGKKYDRG